MSLTKSTKYATIIISVLTASLINEYVVKLINSYYKESTYVSVLIGMVVTILIFVPMFGLVGKWIGKVSKSYLKASKKVAKKSSNGLFLGFLIAFAILFVLFAKTRHNIDVIANLISLLGVHT
ncbi:MAG: hypothetical protein HRT69_03150 [Flavobacteriaceae bacterium]|nr:hypothetical protein [Flavobacteriaceae bacterium]